jgi:hypothetical protein
MRGARSLKVRLKLILAIRLPTLILGLKSLILFPKYSTTLKPSSSTTHRLPHNISRFSIEHRPSRSELTQRNRWKRRAEWMIAGILLLYTPYWHDVLEALTLLARPHDHSRHLDHLQRVKGYSLQLSIEVRGVNNRPPFD